MDNPPNPSELSRNYSGSSQIFTPKPLVRAILNGLDYFLKHKFDRAEGLLDPSICFLDPAAGCLAFPLGLLDFLADKGDTSQFLDWIQLVFQNKLFLFEIDPMICRQDHQIIEAELRKWGPIIAIAPKFQLNFPHLYCLNTLSTPDLKNESIRIRDTLPTDSGDILVVFGNPPYQASGKKTDSPWISSLIDDYKQKLTKKGDKRIMGLKGIQDDYVKFIRFAQWKLHDQKHPGILAYVVNNFFLDGLIFRGLRASLVESFNEIWIINLHGDPKKKHHSVKKIKVVVKDENVFDIQTGVCLFFAIKQKIHASQATIHYSEVMGDKSAKFAFISQSFSEIEFQTVTLNDNYAFIPTPMEHHDSDLEYQQFSSMTDIFKKNMVGAQSLHDTLVTHPDKSQLVENITRFFTGYYTPSEILDSEGQRWIKHEGVEFHDARDWKIIDALEETLPDAISHIIPWQWRGFDQWWVVYDPYLMTRGTMGYSLQQFLLPQQNNRAIGTARVSRKAKGGTSVLMVNTIAESHFIEGGSGIGDYVFPLRINDNVKKGDYSQIIPATESNINPDFRNNLPYSAEISDEDIFYYCYAVLFAPNFRTRYSHCLKGNYPRIPFPSQLEIFKKLSQLGFTLADFHLLNFSTPELQDWPISTSEDLSIRNPSFDPISQRIYFNNSAAVPAEKSGIFWIGNISQDMWDFEIGGIPQLSSWLKARTINRSTLKYRFNRAISNEELTRFLKICMAIKKTFQILPEIDAVYRSMQILFFRTEH